MWLRPCPLCGTTVILANPKPHIPGETMWWGVCPECGLQMGWDGVRVICVGFVERFGRDTTF